MDKWKDIELEKMKVMEAFFMASLFGNQSPLTRWEETGTREFFSRLKTIGMTRWAFSKNTTPKRPHCTKTKYGIKTSGYRGRIQVFFVFRLQLWQKAKRGTRENRRLKSSGADIFRLLKVERLATTTRPIPIIRITTMRIVIKQEAKLSKTTTLRASRTKRSSSLRKNRLKTPIRESKLVS